MNEIGASELDTATKRIHEAATFDEGSRHSQPEECEPREGDEIAPGKDPQPGHPDGQEGKAAYGERNEQIPAAIDRPHESDRTGERRADHRWAEGEHEDRALGIAELGRSDAEQRRSDAQRQRRPEPGAVELDRLRNKLSHSPSLRWERRRKPALCHG